MKRKINSWNNFQSNTVSITTRKTFIFFIEILLQSMWWPKRQLFFGFFWSKLVSYWLSKLVFHSFKSCNQNKFCPQILAQLLTVWAFGEKRLRALHSKQYRTLLPALRQFQIRHTYKRDFNSGLRIWSLRTKRQKRFRIITYATKYMIRIFSVDFNTISSIDLMHWKRKRRTNNSVFNQRLKIHEYFSRQKSRINSFYLILNNILLSQRKWHISGDTSPQLYDTHTHIRIEYEYLSIVLRDYYWKREE